MSTRSVLATVVVLAIGSVLASPGAPAALPVGLELEDPDPGSGQYVLPVAAEVVDLFRPPRTRWGAGNRGWEFATVGGEPVVAVRGGVVLFAGRVARRGVVTIGHEGGVLSSVTGLGTVEVDTAETVSGGQRIGTAAAGLHLGFRIDGDYVDPALMYGEVRHAVLVATP